MKTININRGVKAHIGDWDEAFCLCRGQRFGIHGEFHDDEAQMAFRLQEQGATPMQAAIDMYGHRGRWKRQEQGTNPSLKLPIDDHEKPIFSLTDEEVEHYFGKRRGDNRNKNKIWLNAKYGKLQ